MSGRECMDQIFSLRTAAEKFLDQHQKLFCAFVDLEKAYGRVDHERLWQVLSLEAIDDRLLRAIVSLYDSACVRVNNSFSQWFPLTKGVRKGA